MPNGLNGTLGVCLLNKFYLSWTLVVINVKIRANEIFSLENIGLPAGMYVYSTFAMCPWNPKDLLVALLMESQAVI